MDHVTLSFDKQSKRILMINQLINSTHLSEHQWGNFWFECCKQTALVESFGNDFLKISNENEQLTG